MPNALSLRPPATFRRQGDAELAMRIKDDFKVVAVGDLIQMVPISKRNDPDIQALVALTRSGDVTFANSENVIVDHVTYRGPISHMEAPASVADDWASMGIDMVCKANNHTHDNGDPGLLENLAQLSRVGITSVGADYNLQEARMARLRATPKGTVAFVGAYAKTEDYSQLYGLPRGHPVIVTATQLQQLRAMRDALVARSHEVPNPIDVPPDVHGSVLIFGRLFQLADGAEETAEAISIQKRLEHHLNSRGTIATAINELRLKVAHSVTAEQLAQLRAIAHDEGTGDTLDAWGVRFKAAPAPGEYTYEMNRQDLREILREVRTAKQFSDFTGVTIHWHQNRFSFQKYSFDHYPPQFQVDFAHAVIDNGADFFFAHGVHTLKGVEIYKGKPIFYGVSNYIFQEQIFRSWRDDAERPPVPLEGPLLGEGEINESRWAWLSRRENLKALLVTAQYKEAVLSEVLLYPAELGIVDRPSSEFGTPKRPTLEVAQEILEDVVEYSKPFGTKITIENGVGKIVLLN
ncbi:Capsule synthesis protein, CapA [Niveomyces insectorum RCEF 264]|uniref:Capsule synthesis protein, CapA n=1 Tax=Niveomyces insectorum RCEF 264 TaxID=1081102 RepID=A0A167T8D1_9HYPO|nr:Capsule synthesis protein, CapA [Niveomyces insectorum RCEF 264]